jgi:transposase InsO family protein
MRSVHLSHQDERTLLALEYKMSRDYSHALPWPNQVWSTDITYVPMQGGFLYLVAVMDWFSRFVLSWEISNTMETGFCLAALEGALRFGQPEIWNSDQGAQTG